jgi:hypothetical protein
MYGGPQLIRLLHWNLQDLMHFPSHQEAMCVPRLTHSCYMTCPSLPPRLEHSNYTCRIAQLKRLRSILSPLLNYYPEHPLRFKCGNPNTNERDPSSPVYNCCMILPEGHADGEVSIRILGFFRSTCSQISIPSVI